MQGIKGTVLYDNTVKACRRGQYSCTHSSAWHWMQVSVQLHAPPLYPREGTRVPIEYEAEWPAELVWTFRTNGYICTFWSKCSVRKTVNEHKMKMIVGIDLLLFLVFRVDHKKKKKHFFNRSLKLNGRYLYRWFVSKPRLAESDIQTFCRPYRRSPRTRVFIRRSARSLQAKADASQHGTSYETKFICVVLCSLLPDFIYASGG